MANLKEPMTPRYLLAKYIPDMARYEPKNIGVIVWSPYGIKCRFLAEKPLNPSNIDGRSIPPFVTNSYAYRQWITFWTKEASKSVIEPVCGGEPVSSSSPHMMDVLRQTSKDNFVLEEGGYLLDAIGQEDIQHFVDYLFDTLVNQSEPEEPKDPTLNEISEDVIAKSNIRSTPYFHDDYPLKLEIDSVEDIAKFSHVYQNGKVSVVQKIAISKLLDKNVHSAAWQFEKVREAKLVKKTEDMLALIYATPEQQADTRTNQLLRVLGSVAPVINLYTQREDFEHWLRALYKMSQKGKQRS